MTALALASNDFVHLHPQCPECGRVFDLTDETDAAEWACGHDCEAE